MVRPFSYVGVSPCPIWFYFMKAVRWHIILLVCALSVTSWPECTLYEDTRLVVCTAVLPCSLVPGIGEMVSYFLMNAKMSLFFVTMFWFFLNACSTPICMPIIWSYHYVLSSPNLVSWKLRGFQDSWEWMNIKRLNFWLITKCKAH